MEEMTFKEVCDIYGMFPIEGVAKAAEPWWVNDLPPHQPANTDWGTLTSPILYTSGSSSAQTEQQMWIIYDSNTNYTWAGS